MFTFQALSEEDLQLWLDAMDGKEPMYEHPPKPSDANQTYLDENGFNFIQRCIQVLECRGETGLKNDNLVEISAFESSGN